MPVTVSERTMAELKKQYGTKAKIGKVSLIRGKYVVAVEGRKYSLNESELMASQPLSGLVGKESVAGVIVTDGKPAIIVVISEKPFRLRPILCYIPVPDLRLRIDEAVRGALITNLAKKGGLPLAAVRELQRRRI